MESGMHRTRISLEKWQYQMLMELSRTTRRSLSAIVRDPVDEKLTKTASYRKKDSLHGIVGLSSGDCASAAYVTVEDEDAAWALFRKFRDKDFSYTDCTSFAVMERLRLRTAFAFDRRFAAMGYRVEPAL